MSARLRSWSAALALGLMLPFATTPPPAFAAATDEPAPAGEPPATAPASPAPVSPAPAADDEHADAVRGDPYPGDPALESLLVAAEERRLVEVRAISNAAGWTNVNQGRPYRLVTGDTYTLVLIRRDSPYTLTDLLDIAPSTFVRQPDGSYLLSENIVVEQGATLALDSADGLVLRLASSQHSFVSIVTLGGSVVLKGTSDEPVEVASWDPDAAGVDTTTADGRSYLRVTGGTAEFQHVVFHDLGFWSGATGGIALTGTEVPDVLSDEASYNRVADPVDANPEVFGTELLPTGEADTLHLEPDLSAYSYVSGVVHGVESRDNAFGLFITSADGVDIRDTTIENNLVDGLVLHRYVTNTVVSNTTAAFNAVDGFSLTRASTGVRLDRVEAVQNGRNGITVEGGPLAEGPSATGTPTGIYGNNQVTNSEVAGNGRYGIEVVGGSKLVVDGNTVTGHTMGIVVSDGVSGVTVTDNIVEDSAEQGIALRGGVVDAEVRGNWVSGGRTGIYLRDAGGLVDRNTVEQVSNHAITLIDQTTASTVTDNEVAGMGPSAVDVARAHGDVIVEGNDLTGWQSTKPLDVILRSIFQPLTVLWIALGLLVVITALSSIRRKREGIRDPYAARAPLSSLTPGIVDPASLGLTPAHDRAGDARPGDPAGAR
jgi:hypothetical protein